MYEQQSQCPSLLLPHPDTEVEAAVAYDVESVQRRGLEAVTNFALDEYTDLLSERPCLRDVHIEYQLRSA